MKVWAGMITCHAQQKPCLMHNPQLVLKAVRAGDPVANLNGTFVPPSPNTHILMHTH